MPELIEKYSAEISQTQSIVELIKNEGALKTESVVSAIDRLGIISKILRNHLIKMATTKGRIRGFFHQLVSGKKAEEVLKGIMKGLENAKMDLSIYLQLSNVGLTRGVGEAVSPFHMIILLLFPGYNSPFIIPQMVVDSSRTN